MSESTESKLPQPYKLLVSGVVAIACVTTGLIVGVSHKVGRNVLKPRQFSCLRMAEAESGELLWTVMVRPRGMQEQEPLLRMISGMEGDVTPERRCQHVANTLDRHYSDQLQTLFYRPNPATPNRHAICVQTANHAENDCTNLVILKSNIDPQDFFERFTIDLQNLEPLTAPGQEIESGGAIATFSSSSEQPPVGQSRINLQQWLGHNE